jgi:hypothetical protein
MTAAISACPGLVGMMMVTCGSSLLTVGEARVHGDKLKGQTGAGTRVTLRRTIE